VQLFKLLITVFLSQLTLYAAFEYKNEQFYGQWNITKVESVDKNVTLKIIGQEIFHKDNTAIGKLDVLLLKDNNILIGEFNINTVSNWFLKDNYLYEKNIRFLTGDLKINQNEKNINDHVIFMEILLLSIKNKMRNKTTTKLKIINVDNLKIDLLEEGEIYSLIRDNKGKE